MMPYRCAWGEEGEEKGVAAQDFKEVFQISFHLSNY